MELMESMEILKTAKKQVVCPNCPPEANLRFCTE
jgi:hypothetical protein